MKKLIPLFVVIIAAISIITSCTKDGGLNAPVGQIATSKTTLKINEPGLFALVGADSSKSVAWTIAPAGHDTLATQKNGARIVFTKSGKYTVSASSNGDTPATIEITVNDSVYTVPDNNPLVTHLTGDEITVVPGVYKSPGGDTVAISVVVKTRNSYCTNSQLSFGMGEYMGSYSLQFVDIVHIKPCGIGNSPVTTNSYNYGLFVPKLIPGTYPLQATLNNKTYSGTIVVTATTVTFNWAYTSDILIAPKELSY